MRWLKKNRSLGAACALRTSGWGKPSHSARWALWAWLLALGGVVVVVPMVVVVVVVVVVAVVAYNPPFLPKTGWVLSKRVIGGV